ncbi:alkanesulfonate monooxygenase SsuD/methylene tetrahydromethanopterin reductase-like flavin-dependent oxidoreductase (luciferase family) [Antricoccus suffuscus]|uniref:Alkanesulfonate monooxygenase SsuD/methylene tetrahydromethanopterin reductase-like flavin-dependent oxidoreductase (Luciferase family) n=1 Tax=Antricoccus suffuscus TaxID=1629062 RepID=A0A2T1A6D0_9ACTN|nr:LLM class flavin-dependent oxidoreductase [Antricoccus suffuscus]PRZ44149.1 alkanesulfonate monooxygenase SsuD/methylene tetrahydromethanopterin reductase-like flavin-dependent oxidoreductase (luciferase family) [Antricoccus suffuscus]
MRYGLISHVVGDGDSAQVLRETVALASIAEEAGFSSFWVAQHHFGSHRGHLPSPFVLLGAVAQVTESIDIGTAVVAAALEDPIRLAEDAAVVDALSGGRLHLGLGAGADPAASEAFGITHADRHEILLERLHALCAELEGDRIVPRPDGIRERLWLATGTDEGCRIASEYRLGIMAGRRGSPVAREDADTAVRLADFSARERALGRTPRTGLSRSVFCARHQGEARSLRRGVAKWLKAHAPAGRFPDGYAAEDYLADGHIITGAPDVVARQIAADPGTSYATDFLMNVPQPYPDFADNARSIKEFGAEVIHS